MSLCRHFPRWHANGLRGQPAFVSPVDVDRAVIPYNGCVRPETSCPLQAVVRQALIDTLANESAVVAASLFGSVARGTGGPLSDIDVGLLLADGSRADDRVCGRTMDALCRRLHTSRVDVVALAHAPLPLRYHVVRDGSPVLCRDTAALERFIVESVLQYLDFKPLRNRAFRLVRDAILEKG